MNRMFERFLVHYEANLSVQSRPFPGAVEAMDRLLAAGCGLAICTNKYTHLSVALIEELGLSHYMKAIVGPDLAGIAKPNPGHLLFAIEKAGGNPARSVMVGDSRTDIDAAKAANVPVVAVDFGYTDTPVSELGPTKIISHFDALVEAVDALMPA